MSKYHVYGIGNALVDMEFQLSPELLQQLSIDKGVMTLIDESRERELIETLSDRPSKMISGGSAANTLVAIGQLGGKCFYSCKVADDESGEFYMKDLVSCGIETNLQHHEPGEGITGKCLVFVTPDADRTMNTYLGVSATFSKDELVPHAIEDSQYLYIEGYLLGDTNGKEAAIVARDIAQKAEVKTALSLSDPNMVKFFKEGLIEVIGSGLDFIFANESEALQMADTDNLQGAIAHFKTLAKGFAITIGPKGSVIFDGEQLLEIPAQKVEAIDTVGAGDMYAGAFLYGITHGMSYEKAGHLASRAASKIVTSYGPRLSAEETKALLN
jgi:sugar/nucleoside kinase (ribokinase family)